MKKLFTLALMTLALTLSVSAAPVDAPEISPATGASALTLLSGAVMIIRARARR